MSSDGSILRRPRMPRILAQTERWKECVDGLVTLLFLPRRECGVLHRYATRYSGPAVSTAYRLKRLEDEHGTHYNIVECTTCHQSMGAYPPTQYELRDIVETHFLQYHPGTEQFQAWAIHFRKASDDLALANYGGRVRDLSGLDRGGLGRQLQALSGQAGLGLGQDQMQMASQPLRYLVNKQLDNYHTSMR